MVSIGAILGRIGAFLAGLWFLLRFSERRGAQRAKDKGNIADLEAGIELDKELDAAERRRRLDGAPIDEQLRRRGRLRPD